MVVVNLEEVVEVAADFLCRKQELRKLVAVVIGILFAFFPRKRRKLDVARQVELALDALHVFLPFDMVLERR